MGLAADNFTLTGVGRRGGRRLSFKHHMGGRNAGVGSGRGRGSREEEDVALRREAGSAAVESIQAVRPSSRGTPMGVSSRTAWPVRRRCQVVRIS